VKAVRAREVLREAPLLMEAIKMIVDREIVLKKGEVLDPRGRRMERHSDLSIRVSGVLSRES
jgi:phosphoribosylglycinamide formyltransferase-1